MKNIFMALAVISVFGSCRNLPDFDELTYNPIVITDHDSKANFSDYQNYYISDNVALIGDSPTDTLAPGSVATPILNAINANMESRGYTRVLLPESADIAISTVIIKVTTTVTYTPYYWYGYPGYGGCYYGYCGYYPSYGYPASYSYSTGTLMIQMADLMNVDSVNSKLNMIWVNVNSGVLGSQATNTAAAVSSVNQAFTQSAYIKTN